MAKKRTFLKKSRKLFHLSQGKSLRLKRLKQVHYRRVVRQAQVFLFQNEQEGCY